MLIGGNLAKCDDKSAKTILDDELIMHEHTLH